MHGNTLLRRLFSAGGDTIAAAAQEASISESGYLTRQEAHAMVAELVETDGEGQLIPPVVAHPACPQRIYVALATSFPEEQRSSIAICAGICYIQLLDTPGLEGRACVAALPSHLESTSRHKVQTLSLRQEQLRQMLPWDRTLQRLETCCVREVLQAYVYQLRGIEISAHPYELGDGRLPVHVSVQAPDVQSEHSEAVWTVLPEVFVSPTTAQDFADHIKETAERGGKKTYPYRLFWLKTMITMLDRQLLHLGTKKHPELAHLYRKLLGIAERISTVLKRRSEPQDRPFWVNVNAVRRNGRCLGWHIAIGLPQAVLSAWGF